MCGPDWARLQQSTSAPTVQFDGQCCWMLLEPAAARQQPGPTSSSTARSMPRERTAVGGWSEAQATVRVVAALDSNDGSMR